MALLSLRKSWSKKNQNQKISDSPSDPWLRASEVALEREQSIRPFYRIDPGPETEKVDFPNEV